MFFVPFRTNVERDMVLPNIVHFRWIYDLHAYFLVHSWIYILDISNCATSVILLFKDLDHTGQWLHVNSHYVLFWWRCCNFHVHTCFLDEDVLCSHLSVISWDVLSQWCIYRRYLVSKVLKFKCAINSMHTSIFQSSAY